MNILILGSDGYLGWPTAMDFSAKGHDVTVVDNYFRRRACTDMDVEPLFAVPNLIERARRWQEKTGKVIKVVIGDLAEPEFARSLFSGSCKYGYPLTGGTWDGVPDAVVHYAEQPSAPYSMLDYKTSTLTIQNNLMVTTNLVFAVRDLAPDTHIIKLGTMGEYGTPNIDIEEGWLDIEHKGRKGRFLFPRAAGSIYHTTKVMDTDLMWFGARMWGLRVTDLMQGPVYGLETPETLMDEGFKPFFNYDEMFGTVVNRFVVQAVAGYPLTVYGKGGQTRGYLNLKDTLACVELAAANPAGVGELKIYNQITETFSVNQLADMVAKVGRGMGFPVEVKSIENPRKEAEEHYYNPVYTGLKELGLKPNYLTDEVMAGMFETVIRHKDNIHSHKIFRGVKW
ncbi:MAG: NAD-dependent epimerase/dehydratase family protein [Nitrospirae bacterium]|nr:NAD-dependent epimerase/dehydratase family protein [Nitrospirota bacterium]MBI5696174.1 NAD-dependent epimerase/dehydratase family protein [Nitrospirota bacterium]